MKTLNILFLILIGLLMGFSLQAHIDPNQQNQANRRTNEQVNFREGCANAVTQIDQDINNVRARLTTGGDVWWDGMDGRYIVPKQLPGTPEVSSIFAAGVWLGGKDPGGNLKLAAQTYGRAQGDFDFYPGPLFEGDPNYPGGIYQDPRRGTIEADTCANWDKFFVVEGEHVHQHIANWLMASAAGETSLDPSNISEDILGWPARGNPFFQGIHQFQLPENYQGLAPFWDQPPYDGVYNPTQGDYPIIEIRGCLGDAPPSVPDEMIFWIFNDAGNEHFNSGTSGKMQMEIQVQAFSFVTNDAINNMTFQRYKLINRSIERLDSTYFGFWVDPDLGCYTDDYIGCDVDRDLAYIYNADEVDGTDGCVCDQGVNSYCDEVPILGIDYLRGPRVPHNPDSPDQELGMTSFTYYNNSDVGSFPPGITGPETAQEYYNYLSGRWRDGTPFTVGGDGYQTGGAITPYAFSSPPDEMGGWSMCEENIPVGDRRTIQSSGNFTLLPGAVNELIIGVVWVPDEVYPCPSLLRLQKADDLAQNLFDNCFPPMLGPDAPDVEWVELDREIVAVFSNNELTSNNANENFEAIGLGIPEEEDNLYRFEGYKLYQLSGPNVSLEDKDDPEKVRLVYQVDKKNGVEKIFNWKRLSHLENQTPTTTALYLPEIQVVGENKGIRHTFSITEDQFGESDRRLVNHRKYYFAAVAYAHNNYQEFNPDAEGGEGQAIPYLEGRRNIGDGEKAHYTVIPRKILDRQLQAKTGGTPLVTRVDGVGTGSNFLDISLETRLEIEQAIQDDDPSAFSDKVTYKKGMAPINVKIFNPFDVTNGEYELTFTDSNMDNDELDAPVHWTLRNLTNTNAPVVTSDRPIDELNEQLIKKYGFSVTVNQVDEPGVMPFVDETNGAIGYTEEYLNPDAKPWLYGMTNKQQVSTGNSLLDETIFDYISTTSSVQADYEKDPNQSLSTMGKGRGVFVPYYLCDWRPKENGMPYLSPAWMNSGNQNFIVRNRTSLEALNNVDIVFTSNKDLWSRCVIVETATPKHKEIIAATPENDYIEGDANMFDLRAHVSVGKDAGSDGLPLPDTDVPLGEEMGMGWFPGYAIDVETGQRLNIFFGENSAYNGSIARAPSVGADMMFNPTSTSSFQSLVSGNETILNFPMGGQHYIYVTNQPYDRCEKQRIRFGAASAIQKIDPLEDITWTGLAVLPEGQQMKSYADGLIPDDVIVKIRVNNSYQVETGTGAFNGYPTYRFTLDGEALALDEVAKDVALEAINIVPNPYYGFSAYESSQFENIVKISNLPEVCTVSIYSLDGKFVRTFERNESGRESNNPSPSIGHRQIVPDLEWDLKNFKGFPISSGVYLIHVSAPELGERTLKWFGVNRQMETSGL